MIECRIAPVLILIIGAVVIAGCPFAPNPLDEIPPHLGRAADALKGLDLVEGETNTFLLDEEIYMIDRIFSEMEEIPEEEEEMIERLMAYRTWNTALRTISSIIKDDYHTYRMHLSMATQYYDAFNYVESKRERELAGAAIDVMAGKIYAAASSLEGIPHSALSDRDIMELRRTQAAMMDLYHQSADLHRSLSVIA